MKHQADIIRDIEENFAVETIIANGIPVWQFLRNIYSDALEKKQYPSKKTKWTKNINGISNYFWQWGNRKKQFSAVLFTDAMEERIVDGEITDKIAHNLLNFFGENILVVTNFLGKKHREISEYAHQYYLSTQAFTIPAKLTNKRIKIENTHILKEINQFCQTSVDFQKFVNSFFSLTRVFRKQFVQISPKIIFVNCYFTIVHQAVIYAAKKQDIKTVEFQHGVISQNQSPYFPVKPLGNETCPTFLLSFGESEKDRISPLFIQKENVFSVGNFYLERIKNQTANEKTKKYFNDLRQKYAKTITVSSQNIIENQLFTFIQNVAEILPNVCFVFVPRQYGNFSIPQNSLQNIIINPKVDLYWNARFSDFHATVFSSFASESLFLGTPNILIDIEGLAKSYFSDIFAENLSVKFVQTPEEFASEIRNWQPPPKSKTEKSSEYLFAKNNEKSILRFLEEIT